MAGALGLCVAVLGVGLVLTNGNEADELQPPRPLFVTVGQRDDFAEQSGSLEVVWDAPASVRPTGALTGVVTAVDVEAGTQLSEGQPVLEVNGQQVLAQGGVPLYRDLANGATGEDVVQLEELLQAAGFLSEELTPADRFTARTERAVVALQEKVQALDRDGVYRLTYSVFATTLPLPVAEVQVAVGDSVQPNQTLLVSPTPLAAASFTLDDPSRADSLEGPVRIAFEDGTSVDVSGLSFTQRDFLALQGALPADQTSFPVRVRRSVPRTLVAVPGSALLPVADGRDCVLVGDHVASLSRQLIRSEPSSQAGVVLTSEIAGNETVLANPFGALGAQEALELCRAGS